jgi:hypothetical protein
MKEHFYSRKFHQLTYWDSRTTQTSVDCTSLLMARRIIAARGVSEFPLTTSKVR